MGEDDDTPLCSIFQLIVTTGVNGCMLLSSMIFLGAFLRFCRDYDHKEVKRYVLAHTVLVFLYLLRVVWAILGLALVVYPPNNTLEGVSKFLNRVACLFFYLSLSYYARNWLYVLLYLKWQRAASLCRIAFILIDSFLSLFVLIAAIIKLLPVKKDLYPNLLAYSTQVIGYSSLAIVLFYTIIGTIVLCLWREHIVGRAVVKQFYIMAVIFILSSVLRMVLFNWHQWFDIYVPCDVFNIACIALPDCFVGGCLMKVYYVSLYTNLDPMIGESSQTRPLTSGLEKVYSANFTESIRRLDSSIPKDTDYNQFSENYYSYHSLLN
ncbi:Hypothetical protein GLP15_257 [Giardia lamblia P15]|uniref:THH1/TOM1/TOM3 domain-containing protein n=1 Tax=Giardia intestinalis (strain P15) TaxID=658858 RepID=E1F5X8_GIAIA|nr:Hypothetical protein GLP15_257 [Giardia lamblia P15]